MIKILVSGASGFIGRNLLNLLRKSRAKVYCLFRNKSSTKDLNLDSLNFESLYANLEIRKDVEKLNLEEIDYIIHLSAKIKGDEKEIFESNIAQMKNLIFMAKRFSKFEKFLFVSNLFLSNDNSFIKAKLEAEKILKESNLNYTILRPSLVLGKDSKLIKFFNKRIVILPKSKNLVQPIYIEDFLKILIKSLDKDHDKKTYEIAGQTTISYSQLFNQIGKRLGKRVFLIPKFIAKSFTPKNYATYLDLIYKDSYTSNNASENVFKIRLKNLEEIFESL